MKKVIKDIILMKVADVKAGSFDLAFTINGEDLIDKDVEYGLNKLNEVGLIKNGNIIIPKGFEMTSYTEDEEYDEFNFNNDLVVTDIFFDNDMDEYIA